MNNSYDILGKRFGRLIVLSRSASAASGHSSWKCKCDCGKIVEILGHRLVNEQTKSCGCYRADIKTKHGHTKGNHRTPTFLSWQGMWNRCYRLSSVKYRRYGGRGILICARWYDFANFLADMGVRPAGKSIDRINNDWSYMPSNCRWSTAKEQRANQSLCAV